MHTSRIHPARTHLPGDHTSRTHPARTHPPGDHTSRTHPAKSCYGHCAIEVLYIIIINSPSSDHTSRTHPAKSCYGHCAIEVLYIIIINSPSSDHTSRTHPARTLPPGDQTRCHIQTSLCRSPRCHRHGAGSPNDRQRKQATVRKTPIGHACIT